jgi:hypothetical protein
LVRWATCFPVHLLFFFLSICCFFSLSICCGMCDE